MDCREVHNHLGDVIDRDLSVSQRESLFHHLRLCPRCYIAYLSELIGKILVRKRVPHVQTPADIQSAIVQRIQASDGGTSWYHKFALRLIRRHPIPSLAASIASIALIFYLFLPQGNHQLSVAGLAPNDIVRQTHDNFRQIRSGELAPTMVSCERDLVVRFFEKNNVRFAVAVPPMEGCDWYGAITNEYEEVSLAHVVYKIGDDYLYLYQVEKSEVGEQSRLTLPDAALASLRETGWYTDIDHAECTIILWALNGTLCAAASTMSKDRMLALLSYR